MAPRMDHATKSAVAAMKDEHPEALLCRERGQRHWWEWVTDHPDSASRSYDRQFTCQRCTSSKFLTYSNTGTFQNCRYKYAEGYLLPPGVGRLDGDVVHHATRDLFFRASAAKNKRKNGGRQSHPRRLKAAS